MNIGKMPYYILPNIGSAFSASQGGRISLPVTPSAYIYSHFRHVSGIPAPDGVQGVSISKLKILDALIAEIIRLNKQPKPAFHTQNDDAEKQFAAIVENLQKQIRSNKTAAANPYPAAAPDLGMMFSISA